MLYLLGGAARTGKSILARRFVQEKGIPYLGTDALITLLQEGLPEVGIKHGQPFIPKAEKLWPIIKPLLKHFIELEPDFLVEGDALLPKCAFELKEEYQNKLKVCFTGFTEISPEEKLAEVKKFSHLQDDWTKELNDEEMLEAIKQMIEYSSYLREECLKFNFRYFEIGKNFQEDLQAIFTYLFS